MTSKNIYDVLTDRAGSDESEDKHPDTTSTPERGSRIRGREAAQIRGNIVPITEWARSNEAPPGWKTKPIPLTPDATIIAVHEVLERVASKNGPNSHTNKLTVSRSRHILASIIWNYCRRREMLYDTIHQECLNYDLVYSLMAITHADVDDNPIPITFDLTLMLLNHNIMHMYSRDIQA